MRPGEPPDGALVVVGAGAVVVVFGASVVEVFGALVVVVVATLGSSAPDGRQILLPGRMTVDDVALFWLNSESMLTSARSAIPHHESPSTAVYLFEQSGFVRSAGSLADAEPLELPELDDDVVEVTPWFELFEFAAGAAEVDSFLVDVELELFEFELVELDWLVLVWSLVAADGDAAVEPSAESDDSAVTTVEVVVAADVSGATV